MERRKLIFSKGTYLGEINDNAMPDGEGVFVYEDGSTYVGQYSNGKRGCWQ